MDAADGDGGGPSPEEGVGERSSQPPIAAPGGSDRRSSPNVCSEVFEWVVADGHVEAVFASRAARCPFRDSSSEVYSLMNQSFRIYDWENSFLSLWGSVPTSYLPVSWMMEEIAGKRKRTRPEEEMLAIGDEEEEEQGAVLPDPGEESELPDAPPPCGNQAVPRPPGMKFSPRRTLVQIQDLRRRIVLGARSRFDAKEWTCTRCTWTNKPQKHLIAYIPPFFCENCNLNLLEVDDYEFGFSTADVTVNGFSPICNIKDQGNSRHCTVYAAGTSLEITDRMVKLLDGKEPEGISNEGPVVDTKDFLTKTLNVMKKCNINQGKHHTKFNYKTALVTFEVATTEGVKVVAEGPPSILSQKKVKLRTVKAAGKRFVTCDFASITQRLADGIPQAAYILTGKKFENLKHGQIYKSPKYPEGKNHWKEDTMAFGCSSRSRQKKKRILL